eukprot:153595-Chlamydomonas_euryale.AAC.8
MESTADGTWPAAHREKKCGRSDLGPATARKPQQLDALKNSLSLPRCVIPPCGFSGCNTVFPHWSPTSY